MFLDEQAGNITFEQSEEQLQAVASAKGITLKEAAQQAKYDRPIARPVDIDGRKFIPAFVRVSDQSAVNELEALGVQVQCEFSNGTLFTTLIPVDKLQDVAEIAKVSRINVSAKRRPLTDKARKASNVDDVLTNSADAVAAGLIQKYDGTGVLLGIIDTGIDFQHIAFKDKEGNSRIKRAYVVTASGSSYSAKEYGDGTSNAITSSAPTTDDSSEDHGTHTSSTAGGSSVIVSGSTVTVTDNHANATYGGMAPGADLYLAGCDLSDTYLANSFQKICNYADSKNMPVVVSNSWGGQFGPHDGTGDMADVVNQYFGDSHPNHICLFAASNDAGTNGFHVMGTASSSSPLGTVVNWNTDYGLTFYYGIIANAWTRSTGKTLACKVIVINSSGTKQKEVTVSISGSGEDSATAVSDLSSYVSSGTLYAYRDFVDGNGKSQIILYASNLRMRSGYKLAVQFYPTNGSDVVDIWSGSGYTYYTKTPSTSGYTWTAGSDDMCVSDEAMYENVISIGAYVTKNSVTDYNNTSHSLTSSYPTVGDIAYFSSYATADQSPTGKAAPWICAPGATIVSAVNHYDTSGEMSYINGNCTSYDMYRVNSNTTSPYGSMEGTSMATPCASGIVALWLQAANEVGKELTVNDVKEIMKETAITDAYTTTGSNASHFGNGKIDALAGIMYILGETDEPTIVANPKTVTFTKNELGTYTETVTVKGKNLEGNITATLTDANGIYSIDKTTISATAAQATDGVTLTITYSPTDFGETTATIILSSANANDVTINITGVTNDGGTANDPYLNIAKYATIDEAGWNTTYVNTLYKYTEYQDNAVAWLTLPVYGAWVGTYYNSHPQKWIDSNVSSTSNAYAGTTWNSSEKLLGSGSYFTSANARGMGYNARTNYTQETVSFYVTNITAVQLLGLGQSRSSSTYPATLKVYECTLGSDGSLTASATAVKSESNSATSGTFVLSASDLDASKIYKVEAATYRSYICEIGFQTPIQVAQNPQINSSLSGTIVEEPTPIGTTQTTTFEVSGKNLKSDITVTLHDDNGVFSISKQNATARGQVKKAAANSLTITKDEAENGVTIEVGFTPMSAQEYTATLTLSTEEAEDQVIILNGTGLQPELIASEESLTFADGTVGESSVLSFEILGENLAGDVNISLTDEAGVFSVSPTTVTVNDAEEGAVINVSFTPAEVKDYTATVTLTSLNADPVTVSLAGSATPAYFDATITSAQLSTMYLDFPVIIPYDEYEDLLGVYYVYDTSDASDFRMARINSVIPAYTAVILHGNSGTYRFQKAPQNMQYSGLKHENKLSGTVVTITPAQALEAADAGENAKVYTLGHSGDGYINFIRFTGSKLNPYKAFLIYDDTANTRQLSISWGDKTNTGIDAIVIDDDDEWYTLQGIRLSRRPTNRGLYIHHGETILVK